MIPKTIHYCWFGRGEKPRLAKKCIASWRKFCPDYEIIEWNEDNFDVDLNAYTRFCYDNKKWAFLSDYVRLWVVYEHGGIYFDTDVELIKNPDELLNNKAFFGFETNEYINTGLGFGAEKNNPILKQMIEEYEKMEIGADGSFELIGCPIINTSVMVNNGLIKNGRKQIVNGASVFPVDYFNPLDDATGQLSITDNTYSINHYGKSWLDKKRVIRSHLTRPFHRLFGNDCFAAFRKK